MEYQPAGLCSKCSADGPCASGLRVCPKCSDALDREIKNLASRNWVLTTVDSNGSHDKLYRNMDYLEAKRIWSIAPDALYSHFLRPATADELAINDSELAYAKRANWRRAIWTSAVWVVVLLMVLLLLRTWR